jgi:hypothetical protein
MPGEKLLYYDGQVCHRDKVALASQFHKDEGAAFSRVSMVLNTSNIPNGQWVYANLDDLAYSVTYLPEADLTFFMGQNGNILVHDGRATANDPRRRVVEVAPVSQKHGKLLRIRAVAGRVYACGMSGQVLVRDRPGWTHMDDGLLGEEGLDLEDIDGTGPDDLYVVGMRGAICHFDGRAWDRLDSPTNRPLSNVRCLSREEVYICGNNGLFFRGNARGWTDLTDPDVESNFYGMTPYQGKIYLAHATGLFAHDGTALEAVDFQLDGPVGCHRVHANDGVLWSFGIDDLVYFDGAKWARVICPLNV